MLNNNNEPQETNEEEDQCECATNNDINNDEYDEVLEIIN